MFAYNSHDIDSLGLSPMQLLFGTDPRLPLDLMASPDTEFQLDHHQYHVWHTAALRDVFHMVQAFAKRQPKSSAELRTHRWCSSQESKCC